MKIPENVEELAHRAGYPIVKYLGQIGEDKYYVPMTPRRAEDDPPAPTGFPSVMRENADKKVVFLCGPEVFSIIRTLDKLKQKKR